MGWLSGWNSKRELIAHLRDNFSNDGCSHRILRDSVVGRNFWFVAEHKTNGERSIVLCLLSGKFKSERCGPWGYKDMGESSHPYYYDCPLGLLDLAPVACQEWRDGVRAYHRAKKRTFAVGERVSLPDTFRPHEFVITSVKPLLGREFNATTHDMAPFGRDYRLPRTRILEAKVAEPAG